MEWKQRIDPVEKFIKTNLEFEASQKIPKKYLFDKYDEWCKNNKIVSVAFSKFNSAIKEIENVETGTDKIHGIATVTWHGIRIK